jgi:Tripartite tricarboxylate transporter family receptor
MKAGMGAPAGLMDQTSGHIPPSCGARRNTLRLCAMAGLGGIMPTRRQFTAGILVASTSPMRRAAQAQPSYPDRPIRILAGYPAGGGIDLVARLIGDPMKAALGQPVIVENRTGAAAMIAAHAVAKAAPDGHTLLMATSGEVAINHHVYRDRMTYDPLRELTPVALIGIVPCVVLSGATRRSERRPSSSPMPRPIRASCLSPPPASATRSTSLAS